MEPKARHWLLALGGALAVHLSLLTLFERPAKPLTPVQGVLIELGKGGDVAEGPSGSESLSPLGAADLPEAEPVTPRAEEIDAEEAEPTEDLIAVAEPVPVPNTQRLLPKPKPKPESKPSKRKKTRFNKPKKKAPKTRRDKKTAKASARKTAGGGKAKAGKRLGTQGAGKGSGASAAALRSRYAGQISAWLNRNKRYPKEARRRGQQGSVTARFTVDRTGRVLSSAIVRSSGYAALDDEVRALLRRGRMPRMPEAMKQTRMTMAVPIRFRLQ